MSSYSGYVLFGTSHDINIKVKEEIKIEKGMITILTIKDGDYSIKMEQL